MLRNRSHQTQQHSKEASLGRRIMISLAGKHISVDNSAIKQTCYGSDQQFGYPQCSLVHASELVSWNLLEFVDQFGSGQIENS